MAVKVQRNPNLGTAEAFACHLGVDATCEQVGGMGMPQIMVLPFPFLGVL
jgi:hypothetical protein